jgi:hypothetical protein
VAIYDDIILKVVREAEAELEAKLGSDVMYFNISRCDRKTSTTKRKERCNRYLSHDHRRTGRSG